MTLTMLIFFVLGLVNQNYKERLLARFGLLFSVAMIILSTSKSGLIIFISMLIVVLLSRLFRWKGRRSVLALDIGGLALMPTMALLILR